MDLPVPEEPLVAFADPGFTFSEGTILTNTFSLSLIKLEIFVSANKSAELSLPFINSIDKSKSALVSTRFNISTTSLFGISFENENE